VDATDRHEVLRGPSVRVVPIPVRLHWLVSVQTAGDLQSGAHVLHFLSHGD
jgi:hypothetical protein